MIYVGDFNSGRHRNPDSPGTMMRDAGLSQVEVFNLAAGVVAIHRGIRI